MLLLQAGVGETVLTRLCIDLSQLCDFLAIIRCINRPRSTYLGDTSHDALWM
jgi:hypothetical protein